MHQTQYQEKSSCPYITQANASAYQMLGSLYLPFDIQKS
ncbi:hypothetical protein A6A12_2703 [Vibrio anguillarum]|nr:hypothetical protein A6A12_2703 [Vibrio anguillarum]